MLTNIRRKNISVNQLVDLGLHSKRVGVNSYSEIILGLPGDSKQAHYSTVRQIIDAGFNIVLPWQLMLINGSELASRSSRKKYQMDTRYRIFPRCFGSYKLFGQEINVAEIEEVCVANSTLPFQDYLECRKMNLFVAIFYNDSVFSGLLKLLRSLNVSIFDWILVLLEDSRYTDLHSLVTNFIADTQSELWTNKEELEEFYRDPDNIQRYVAGELGRNNLYYYRTLAITQNIDTLKILAKHSTLKILKEKGKYSPEIEHFLDQLLEYHSLRIRNIFDVNSGDLKAEFAYDFLRYENESGEAAFGNFHSTIPSSYRFYLSGDQQDLITRSLSVHGSDSIGKARILSRVFVKKLFRQVATV